MVIYNIHFAVQQKETNGQVSQVPTGRMGPSVEGSRVSSMVSSSGRELRVVREHIKDMVLRSTGVLI